MALVEALQRILERPTMMGVCTEMMMFLSPIWVAFLVGVMVGWAWKPNWPNLREDNLGCSSSKPLDLSSPSDDSPEKGISISPSGFDACRALESDEGNSNVISEEDLEHLCQLVEMKDVGPTWIEMMDRSTPTMYHKAWRRDPKTGPPQYRSSTIFENATPEMVRDFFWDDEFRSKWDDMLAYSKTLEECPTTGTMLVHWVRKFPFFCKDREYIIGRRIWELGRLYYCITKGVPCPSVPRHDKPRRVDLYYSSWCVRPVESTSGDGQLTACEVLLFHHEDMGIPWELAKIGVKKGLWGTVKKIDTGFRAYQKERASGAPLSRPAFMASINTKINPDYMRSLGEADDSLETQLGTSSEKQQGRNIRKLLIIGGAIIFACTLDHGLLTKTLIFGVARRFANVGKRL
ncbi:START domain containing protein [Parasponia andersonii]|uniref:START domain containing protein n=1 Tax=Parasponia andersonii TaxID=3476 RepID=A0A2P5DFA8_PARAD|nr:START domain containing protein [Parasponia andersonii]